MHADNSKSDRKRKRRRLALMASRNLTGNTLRLLVFALVVVLGFVATVVLRVQDHAGDLLHWMENNKEAGAFVLIGLYAICAVLPLPGSVLGLAAGAIFGIALGALLVWIGATVGAVLGLSLGRWLLRAWVAAKAKRYPLWQAVERAVAEEGWKMLLLLRVSPLIPYTPLNYIMSITSIPFKEFFWASAVGLIPISIAYAYFGSLAHGVGEILAGRVRLSTGAFLLSVLVSGVLLAAALGLAAVYTKRAIQRRLEEEEREQLLGQQTGSSSAAREGPPDVQAKGADAAERQRDPDIV